MWRVLVAALGYGVVFFPISTSEIPVYEPHLFGFEVLLFEVEHTVVSYECLESFLMMTCKPIYRESAVRCSHTAQTVFVDIAFFAYVVDSRQVVFHILSAVVAAYLFEPLLSEAIESATVGSNHDIPIGCHYLEVPTVAPKLTYGRLRSALAVEQSGIFLRRVEVGRIYHPSQHILFVGSLYPTWFDVGYLQLVEDMFVFERYLSLLAATGVYRIYLVWHLHRVPSTYQAVSCESYGFVVVLSVGYTRYFFLFQVGSVYLGFAVPYTD